jgi:hypothetical protein
MMNGHASILTALAVSAAVAWSTLSPAPASAEAQFNSPWAFSQTNRASIAVYMRQREDQKDLLSAGAGGTGSTAQTFVCGSAGEPKSGASALGNSTCIILNNADGQVTIDQDSLGDQGASATSDSTTSDSLSGVLGSMTIQHSPAP